MIEKWVTITSNQRYEGVDDAPDDLLPPWVSPIRPVQINNSSNFDSPPAIEEEEEVVSDPQNFDDDNSECSLPQIADKQTNLDTIFDSEEYSVLAARESISLSSEPDDELEAYRTPCPEFSPKSNSPEPLPAESNLSESLPDQFYLPHSPPNPYYAFRNKSKNKNYNDNDSQATEPYDTQETAQYNIQATMPHDNKSAVPYNSQATVQYDLQATAPHDSQATVPYDNQATVPFNADIDTLETEPYDPNNDSQTSASYGHPDGSNIPAPYTPNNDYRANVQYNLGNPCSSNSSHYENAKDSASKVSSPCQFLSPLNDDDSLSHLSPPHMSPEPQVLHAELFDGLLSKSINETTLNEPDLATSRKHYLQDDDIIVSSSRPKSSAKIQKLNTYDLPVVRDASQRKGKNKESSPTRSIKSQEIITLVRPEKRQIRSSVLKIPMTIENYFLNSSTAGTSQDEGELGNTMLMLNLLRKPTPKILKIDIGRDSVAPSFCYSNADVTKEEKHDPKEPVDRRRRPRFGLSKKVLK